MSRKHSQAKYPRCPVCQEKRERNGWCDRCRSIAADINAALAEDRVADETGRGGERAHEGLDVQRRLELHRARRRYFATRGRP